MEKELREKLDKIISAYDFKQAILDNKKLGEGYIELMQAAYKLAKQEDAENIDSLKSCQDKLMNLIAYNHVSDDVCPYINQVIHEIDLVIIKLKGI